MRLTLLALLSGALIAAAGASAATQLAVKVTLTGVCTSVNTDDHNGVVTSSTLTCNAKATCSCQGATHLVYQTATVSAGNGGPGKERGTLVATGPHGAVTLMLVGTRNTTAAGAMLSKGKWTLGKVSGEGRTGLAPGGAYTMQTTNLSAVTGTTSTRVKISAAIGCWACTPRA